MPIEMVQTALEVGMGAIFLWLYLRLDERFEKQAAKHDADMARLYDQRITDLKLVARLPTDLEGSQPAHKIPA